MATGDWGIYLVMSVLMEYIVTVIYTTAGTNIPLQNRHRDGKADDEYALYGGLSRTGYVHPTEQAYAPQTAYDPSSHSSHERIAYAPPPMHA